MITIEKVEALIRNPPLGPALAPSELHSISQIRASLYSSPPQCPKPFPLPKFWLLYFNKNKGYVLSTKV